MRHLGRVKNAVIVAGFCILLAGSVASMEKNEYRFGTVESETENTASEMQEQVEEVEYEYPIILSLGDGYVFCLIESEDIFLAGVGGSYKYIKKTGEVIFEGITEKGYPFSEGLACVKLNGKYGYIDTNGEMVIPCIYDDAAPFQEGLAYFVKDGRYGFMRKDESVAFYLGCDSISSFQEERAYFCMDGKYGYYDRKGNIAIEPVYSDAGYFRDGVAFVALDGVKGAIDVNGNVIIPIMYDYLERDLSRDSIIATLDEKEVYYSLSGEELTKEEYKSREIITDEEEQKYTAKFDYEADIFKVYDTDGSEVLAIECDYISHDIYGDYSTNYVLNSYGWDNESYIVLLSDVENIDLSDVLLKNAITPKQEEYWQMLHGSMVTMDVNIPETDIIDETGLRWIMKKTKLYDVNHSGDLVLYCYSEPGMRSAFPLSDSAFYAVKDGVAHGIVGGYECGGSSRGHVVCLWQDVETGEMLIGYDGMVGGIGGYALYSEVFAYKDGEAESVLFYDEVWTDNYYSEEDLLKYANLYYDDEGNPYTKDTILDAERVTFYRVDDEHVSAEDYERITGRYKYVSLLD